MNDLEKYQFDLNGYILVKNILTRDEVSSCLEAAKKIEPRVAASVDSEPFSIGKFGIRYHVENELGCSWYKSDAGGLQYIVEDFITASSAFDCLINHAATMKYVEALSRGPYHISSAELRYRYKGNYTPTHMGGPIDPRNRYEFIGRQSLEPITGERKLIDFDLICVRVLYALHDVSLENGPLCVVPGTHKANFFSPYGENPSLEPGMIGIPMNAGDAIFFTENLRHGGFPNALDNTRTTIHLVINPAWVGSQSPAHWDDRMYVAPETFARYSAAQRALFPKVATSPSGTMTGPSSTNKPDTGVNSLVDQLQTSQAELHDVKARLSALENSRMWRATQPVRKVIHRARSIKSWAASRSSPER